MAALCNPRRGREWIRDLLTDPHTDSSSCQIGCKPVQQAPTESEAVQIGDGNTMVDFVEGSGEISIYCVSLRTFSEAISHQQSKHRHRRANGDDYADGIGDVDTRRRGPLGVAGSDDGELENFIALAPDEADIYNFSDNLINTVDNAALGSNDDVDNAGDGGGGGSEPDQEDANEANPFNEFLNPSMQQQQNVRAGKPQLEDPWGLELDKQQLPVPAQVDYDTEAEKSKHLKALNRSQQTSPLLASSIDFLNSIDGGYLLSNGMIDEKGRKLSDDNSLSTLKPDGKDSTGEAEQVNDDDIFEQMQKKAKSYRLKLYKKHKNFKHSHHHRSGYYHPVYQHHHHQYYRQKMLERERDRWKQLHDQQLKADYQGKIRYFDSSNKLETKDDIKAHLDGYTSREQWPHFDKVMNSLNKEQQQDNVPPYIKKYNRRNKQLIDLLEGTIAPLSDYSQRHHERKYHRRKNPNWMEEDLFEQQRPNQNNLGLQRNYIQETIQSSTAHSNSLPGEAIHIIYDKKHMDNDHEYGHPTTSVDPNHPYKMSSRAGQFAYHRVASPQPVGGGYGRLKRQRLPFVAITDRRLGSPPKRRPNSSSNTAISSSNSNDNSGSNNLLNHQPMP
ncbi:uncharacterized protein LOC128745700 [Sabethes cyaneus]|uniref:uncharacterized protein LOC128745700 n=1 Tax=Sabethes cyaneus TaxID=53552 RepID=UPI00237E82C2|nr:uncharacterized protein LOC128745700 [Sabethes cyaneus]